MKIETVDQVVALIAENPYTLTVHWASKERRMVMKETVEMPYLDGRFVRSRPREGTFPDRFSLLDANVIPNSYNDWVIFTTDKEAVEHAGL